MKILSFITIRSILSILLSFVFILNNYQSLYDEHNISAFKPSNANKTETAHVSENTTTYQFVKSWGRAGGGDGEFFDPAGIVVDASLGDVFVADASWNRIQKFDSNGNFITKWGIKGTGEGQFDSPVGIATDSQNNVYVADSGNYRIQKFDSNGNFIKKWGSEGFEDGQFYHPEDIDVDSQDNIYMTDYFNHRVQVFAPTK